MRDEIDLAILVYVDNKATIIEEFSWLYKSMIYSGTFSTARLIAVCHPQAVEKLPTDDRIIKIASVPLSERDANWADYGFINSVFNICQPEVEQVCSQFKYVLKTDCDTFVTPELTHFRPSLLCFGNGAYAYEDSVRQKLVECAKRWGFPHIGTHNVGASVMGPVDKCFHYLRTHFDSCIRIREEEFKEFTGEWPGWFRGVLTMYAGELALRLTYPETRVIGLLDHFCMGEREFGSDVLHIHAWHTESYWSKHVHRAGGYQNMAPETINRKTLSGYCHWIADSDIDTVLAVAAVDRT